MGFHAFPVWVPGGFVGVDVFFVISGYLISTILFKGLEQRSFSFFGFYARRLRRIFPALAIVLLTCLVLGWFTLFSSEYMQLGKHVAGSAGFVSNFVSWSEAGYFDKSAETKPLLHIWSLGIEEQFYIVWPLLLYLTWNRKIGSIAWLVVLLVGTFVLNVLTVTANATADFYSPLTRFWELLAGGLLSYFSLYKPAFRNFREKRAQAMSRVDRPVATSTGMSKNIQAGTGASLLLIAGGLPIFDQSQGYPGWWALFPVGGTFLMISAGRHAYINDKILSARILVAIGLISCPLYLWHWPALYFQRLIHGNELSIKTLVMIYLASFLLAFVTYVLVERPLRSHKIILTKTFVPLIGLMTVIGSAGYYVYVERGFSARNQKVEDIAAAATDLVYQPVNAKFAGNGAMILGKTGADQIILLGDSMMEQYLPRVLKLIDQHTIDLDRSRIVMITHGGCPPLPDLEQDSCGVLVTHAFQALLSEPAKTVVFAAFWSAPASLRENDQPIHALTDFMSRLVKSGRRVFVILENPVSRSYAPEAMLPTGWNRLVGTPKIPEDPTRLSVEKFEQIDDKHRYLAEDAGAHVINPKDYLCDKSFVLSLARPVV